jgi:hypothetical protein
MEDAINDPIQCLLYSPLMSDIYFKALLEMPFAFPKKIVCYLLLGTISSLILTMGSLKALLCSTKKHIQFSYCFFHFLLWDIFLHSLICMLLTIVHHSCHLGSWPNVLF